MKSHFPLVLLASLVAGTAPASGQLPRVHVIATGGTIASTPDGSLSGEALLAALPGLDTVAEITVEQFSNVGSSQITPEHWLGLSRRIAGLYASDSGLAGVVVTHGTDTMEETAWFLHLVHDDDRPVVVTGAMRPARAIGADGPANLMGSIRVAADPRARNRSVLVLLNDEIHAAPAVTKTNTTRVDAFVSTRGGPLGVVDPDGIRWHAPPAPGPLRGAFGIPDGLPRVEIAYAYGGADGTAMRAFADVGARAVVIATVGRGNLPSGQREALRELVGRGLVVALSSRVNGGRVPVGVPRVPGDSTGGATGATFGAGELNPQKARVLLMLALSTTQDPTEIARFFDARRPEAPPPGGAGRRRNP